MKNINNKLPGKINNNKFSLEEKFTKWNDSLKDSNNTQNNLGYNSIWKQMLDITQDFATFTAYQTLEKYTNSNLNNTLFRNMFINNYYISQSTRIRKLSMLNDTDYSLASLWEDIRKLQYSKEDLISIYNSSNDVSTKKSSTIDKQPINMITQTLVNNVIDDRNNQIKKSIVKKINKCLLFDQNKNLKNIYDFASKYITHAANYDNRQNVINKITSTMIENAIKDLTIAFSALLYFVTANQTTSLILDSYTDKLDNLDKEQQEIVHGVFDSVKEKSEGWIKEGQSIINNKTFTNKKIIAKSINDVK